MTDSASSAGSSSYMTEALLTMDVVDQLRRRESELLQLGESSLDTAGLKARLRSIYESQGIDVTDEILDAGIAAQREKRFNYLAPKGPKAWLAKQWVNRKVVGKRLVGAASVTALFLCVGWGIVSAGQYLDQRAINAFNADADALAGQYHDLELQLMAEKDAAARPDVSVMHGKSPERIQAMWVVVGSLAQEASKKAEAALMAVHIPRIRKENGKTIFAVNGIERSALTAGLLVPRGEGSQKLAEAASKLDEASNAIGEMHKVIALLDAGINASDRLDSANAAATAAGLPKAADDIRVREYAIGDVNVRAGKIKEAVASAVKIENLEASVAEIAAMGGRLDSLKKLGLASGVSGQDLEQFNGAIERARGLAQIETVDKAEGAVAVVEGMVFTLLHSYTYRIVNRSGVRSGVWRHSNDNPGTRNYYVIVEALDDEGNVVSLPIHNEEDGTTQEANIFGLRVSEDAFNAVAQDKRDNGIIENDVVGKKAIGQLNPHFDIAGAGGYITRW